MQRDNEDHKRDRLARWVCDLPSVERRRDFLDRLQRQQGKHFADDIRRRVRMEWNQRQGEAQCTQNR